MPGSNVVNLPSGKELYAATLVIGGIVLIWGGLAFMLLTVLFRR
jgi:hypothetical protein